MSGQGGFPSQAYILVRPLIMYKYKNELEYMKYKLFFAETNQTVVS